MVFGNAAMGKQRIAWVTSYDWENFPSSPCSSGPWDDLTAQQLHNGNFACAATNSDCGDPHQPGLFVSQKLVLLMLSAILDRDV
jgi:hypothetical protein